MEPIVEVPAWSSECMGHKRLIVVVGESNGKSVLGQGIIFVCGGE